MAVHVLEEETRTLREQGFQVVLLESDIEDSKDFHLAIRELQHPGTRNMAIQAATRMGVANARVGMMQHPFPVDVKGNTVTRPMEQQVHRYRIEVEVTSKAV